MQNDTDDAPRAPHAEALVVCGVPASGKTSFAKHLATRLRWPLLDLDTLTNPLFEYVGGEYLVDVPTAEPAGRATVNDVRYKCLFDTAAENLGLGVNVILVAPFTSERTFAAAWGRLVENLGVDAAQVHCVWVDTPADEIVARMVKRSADRDLEKIKNPSFFLSPEVMRAPGIDFIRVDGLLSTPDQVEAFTADFASRSSAEAPAALVE